MKSQKEKFKKQFNLPLHQNNKIQYLGINLPKKTHMEIYIMFVGWKIQYCQNQYTPQGNLLIQCNLNQTTNGFFHRTRTKKILKFVWRHKIP